MPNVPIGRPRKRTASRPSWVTHLVSSLAIMVVAAMAALLGRLSASGFVLATLGVAALALTAILQERREALRWRRPVGDLTARVAAIADGTTPPTRSTATPELTELVRALARLQRKVEEARASRASADLAKRRPPRSLTRSGLYESHPLTHAGGIDPTASGGYSTLDMVSRLDPKALRWLDSSPAEQDFLGWSLADLRKKSFPEIVHSDDRALAFDQLQAALVKGEAHGLIYRIKTARGEMKAVEMNVSVRYDASMAVTHLRCHVTDVTAQIRAGRELHRRTRELTRVNQQLRSAIRELEELKDRYSDLYQNAPAMYFSLDPDGHFLDCNATLLRTLGYQREDLIGRPYTQLMVEPRRLAFAQGFATFLREGHVEVEGRWVKANGDPIDVWVTGSTVVGPDGTPLHSRNVAQDVTARRALEAELRVKNDRLAQTNVELSRKNKELDEFTYVVSHDLQEPLRTLIAFSDFLMKDYGDRLDVEGQEYVRYLVDASRRMRALISDLLNLSRAGRVTGDFGPVNLEEVVGLVKSDFAELIRARGAEIRVAAHLPTVWGDRDRIGQLFGNLISNGLKYNLRSDPTIEIGSMADDAEAWATLYVRDNGIGIDPQFHAKIFQIFRRLHTREEYEGTGAGLAICQKIVQAHGGRIWVESEPGRGATFFVRLPLQPAEIPLRTELLHAP